MPGECTCEKTTGQGIGCRGGGVRVGRGCSGGVGSGAATTEVQSAKVRNGSR